MFKLYSDKGTRKIIDISEVEQDIIDTMGDYLKDDPEARFLIIENKDNTDNLRGFIRGYAEYINYVENYNLRQMSCIELKKGIVKKIGTKKK